jgi:hypothetical protein
VAGRDQALAHGELGRAVGDRKRDVVDAAAALQRGLKEDKKKKAKYLKSSPFLIADSFRYFLQYVFYHNLHS